MDTGHWQDGNISSSLVIKGLEDADSSCGLRARVPPRPNSGHEETRRLPARTWRRCPQTSGAIIHLVKAYTKYLYHLSRCKRLIHDPTSCHVVVMHIRLFKLLVSLDIYIVSLYPLSNEFHQSDLFIVYSSLHIRIRRLCSDCCLQYPHYPVSPVSRQVAAVMFQKIN